MASPQQYDAIVIGSGQAGTPLCQALATAGMRTALVEREHVGGTCVNEGCTPTKTMIASGRVAYLTRRGADYGVQTSAIRIAMERVRKRKRDIVNEFRTGNEDRIKKTKGLDLIYGQAAFTGPKCIEVRLRNGGGKRDLTAASFFINAGCRPAVPQLKGLSDVPYLNSTSVMELTDVPKHLLVLGGGYVGLEFGQLFRRLGSRVTNTGQGMTWRRLPSTGGGMQFAGSGVGVAVVHVGCSWSKSLPVLRIVLNSSSVWPPSGRPVLSGVKLRVIMLGPTYAPYSAGG
jgi:pyruvate/2-oxoglutarate dehydrogenase complex dihydrolipoamide dehydrogenase (E3) component